MLITGYLWRARGTVVDSCNISDGVGGGHVEDRGDGTADLEAAISDTWSSARANARTGAKALDPRLDAAACPLVSMPRWRGAMRPSDLYLDRFTVSRQIDSPARLLGRLTAVDLR